MTYIRKTLLALAASSALSLAATGANAAVTFTYNDLITGTAPSGTGPWLTALFEDTATPGQVKLTLTSDLNDLDEFWSKIYFNLNPDLDASDLSATNVTNTGGFDFPTFDTGTFNDAGNTFDIEFGFETAGSSGGVKRFSNSDIFVVTFLLNAAGLDATDFAFPADGKGYYSSAHVQGIATGAGSGKLGPDDPFGPTEVPLPAAAWLFMAGLVPLAGFLRKRRAALEV
jgi:hypothetical protein